MAHAATVVKFTALYGTTAGEPLCSVLRFDDYAVLLDCGWTEAMDPAVLEPLRRVAPQVRGVLITHPDLTHMGALPYVEKPKPKTKIFCSPCFFFICKESSIFYHAFSIQKYDNGCCVFNTFF
jgi:Cft2 family RNA processing exonuclease